MPLGVTVRDWSWRRMDLEADQRSLLSRYLRGPAVLEEAVADLRDVDRDAPPSQGGWTIRAPESRSCELLNHV